MDLLASVESMHMMGLKAQFTLAKECDGILYVHILDEIDGAYAFQAIIYRFNMDTGVHRGATYAHAFLEDYSCDTYVDISMYNLNRGSLFDAYREYLDNNMV